MKLKPRDDLQELIKLALQRGPLTEEEVRQQRESWVRGEMGMGLDRDEAPAPFRQPHGL